ncbi:YebC/PmpR family DNA-binding transcriptional regulator [Cyanobium sp. Morenito 9A2]|uniref:YebC/PmpR family DNA-binding transcriptional regulator n=1 Tax=Cyanobium sp. Morenito 9A2 TaxID=2823718 RepID=UPI0020CFB9F0|nr:YebC/PmpR family DNA-binding transcriptional regulator [Cyanobium sp. Morenito 9A2]MCP9849097.1 YebC/PmpR family DNA-binding transcriptional regulator [Cyanobium sp. Morenito 9A2]
MAGHSKWSQIKRTKAVVDARRGAVFTRLGREITVAARTGADPAGNFQLRTAIEKARAAGMPNANIERAISKGSGRAEAGALALEEVRYEGYGPGGVAVLVEAFSDNRHRTAADLRLAFSKHGGNLGESGCVGYLFDLRGVVHLSGSALDEEALLESVLELEVISYSLEADGAEVLCGPAQLEELQAALVAAGWNVEGCELRWQAQTPCLLLDLETLRASLRLLEALESLEDVRSVSSNLEAPGALLEAAMA